LKSLLLDTHLLVWGAKQPERLSKEAAASIADPENELFFSAVSIWEIAIKQGLKKPDFDIDARTLRRRLLENGYRELALTGEHGASIELLPPIHSDPFDRILIAQASCAEMTLLTSDSVIAKYPGPIRKV